MLYNYSDALAMVGIANAIVVNYTNTPIITLSGSSYNASVLKLTNYLNSLENSGNIITYSPNVNQFSVLLNTSFNAFELQQALVSKFGKNVTVSGKVYVRLPKTVKMHDGTQEYTVIAPNLQYSIAESPLPQIGSNVSVHIIALVTQNGFMIPNQTKVAANK